MKKRKNIESSKKVVAKVLPNYKLDDLEFCRCK